MLLAALLLTGCANTQAPPPAPTGSASTAAVIEIDATSSLSELVTYGRSLSGSTPELAAEIQRVAQLIPEADADALPWDVHNEVNRDLMTLNADIFEEPSDAASMLGDLNEILDRIEESM